MSKQSFGIGGAKDQEQMQIMDHCKILYDLKSNYSNSVLSKLGCILPPPLPGEKKWVPKNPKLQIPYLRKEISLSEDQWARSNFPFFAIPDEITTHVNLEEWEKVTSSLCAKDKNGYTCMKSVLGYLKDGVDSGVEAPGNLATLSKNSFPDPPIDIPRLADAFCSEIKAKHMAGPFPPNSIKDAKINSLLSVKKPDGSRWQVGNLSAPKGSSFNDGINPESLKEWKVLQTTSKNIAEMIARSGRNALLSCCDMVSAYKALPVCRKQRRLQCFRFLGKDFVDLRMVFGDRKACMFFDKFHYCIIEYFVLPKNPIPRNWVGRTIDDVPIVAPQNAKVMIEGFTRCYKSQLNNLGTLNIGGNFRNLVQLYLDDLEDSRQEDRRLH